MSEDYDVSQKLSRPADLQRICCAVSFSMTVIGPPQQGQSQTHGPAGLGGKARSAAARFLAVLDTEARPRRGVG
jgi:hypothetical protein